jgi:hypothetical protein
MPHLKNTSIHDDRVFADDRVHRVETHRGPQSPIRRTVLGIHTQLVEHDFHRLKIAYSRSTKEPPELTAVFFTVAIENRITSFKQSAASCRNAFSQSSAI